jgi:hypothetical protein
MKNQQLKNLIKEEIKSILKEETAPNSKMEVKKLTDYLTGIGKGALAQINTPEELDAILNIIWSGMNSTMQKNPKAAAVKKLIDQRL